MSTKDQMNNHNSDNGESMEDLLAVYALGGLDDNDLAAFESELTRDMILQRELRPYQFVSEALVLSGPPMQMSEESKTNLMARVEANARARFGDDAVPTRPEPQAKPAPAPRQVDIAPVPTQKEGFFRRLFSSPLLSGASLAAALGFAIFVGVLSNQTRNMSEIITAQQTELETANSEISKISETVAFLESSVASTERDLDELAILNAQLEETVATNQGEIDTLLTANSALNEANEDLAAKTSDLEDQLVVALEEADSMSAIAGLFGSEEAQNSVILGTELAPEATAQVVYNPGSTTAVLVVDGLSELEEDLEYQILLIRGGEHDTADTFKVNTTGNSTIVINAPFTLDTFDSIGVSIEPEGGSEQRTGEIVLLGGINQVEVSS